MLSGEIALKKYPLLLLFVKGREAKKVVQKKITEDCCKPYLPSLILGNVRSLQNKMKELGVNVKYANEIRSASLKCFTETWSSENVADSHVNIEGFSIFHANRTNDSGKLKGGGMCTNNGVTQKT